MKNRVLTISIASSTHEAKEILIVERKECQDCGKRTTDLINNFDPEHGEFYQCKECYKAFVESWE